MKWLEIRICDGVCGCIVMVREQGSDVE